MAFLTLVIAATGVVGIILVIQGGRDTRRIRDAAERQAGAAERFSGAADGINSKIGLAEKDFQQLAKTTQDSVKTAQDSLRLEQRAWVGETDVQGKPEAGKHVKVTFTLTNSGRTPAIDVIYESAVASFFGETKFTPTWGTPPQEFSVGFPIMPTSSAVAYAEGTISQPQFDRIMSKKTILYAYGRMCYKDVFQGQHWLKWCSVYKPDEGEWNSCESFIGDDTDKSSDPVQCESRKKLPNPN